jgi:hypothetical protein
MIATHPIPPASRERRGRGDEGAALVEFALVFIFFVTLIFGIMAFGVLLSFQQTLTHAANEAARAGAVVTDNKTTAPDERQAATATAIAQFNQWGKRCNVGDGLTCTYVKRDCSGVTDTAALPDCITVTLTYDYQAHPILPDFPFISNILPNKLVANATAQISDP